jgi:hypothetical protein
MTAATFTTELDLAQRADIDSLNGEVTRICIREKGVKITLREKAVKSLLQALWLARAK